MYCRYLTYTSAGEFTDIRWRMEWCSCSETDRKESIRNRETDVEGNQVSYLKVMGFSSEGISDSCEEHEP